MMPHEFSLHLHQLYLEVVQFTYDLGAEVVLKGGKFLRQIHYIHKFPFLFSGPAGPAACARSAHPPFDCACMRMDSSKKSAGRDAQKRPSPVRAK
jgi:hypothetical protein